MEIIFVFGTRLFAVGKYGEFGAGYREAEPRYAGALWFEGDFACMHHRIFTKKIRIYQNSEFHNWRKSYKLEVSIERSDLGF